MNNQKLNLARKWRSQNFDQIIGQDLSVRMLKNSLYLGHYFPVYLFSGQRGCGKTSTARIFAAAINCENLENFKVNPREHSVPCLTCSSCQAVKNGRHPDFIEMDAASHTGVDNIRSIIEASTLMPLMGSKKIYLIDEAHMLSKAAFNAFLKILEEPPMSVVFILATTDPEKIIETVKSRCFQLFFKPINNQQLIDHLQHVCLVESIVHDRAGLELIVKESEGCARDALNMLEQVRFSSNAVTVLSVSQVLGHVDDRHIFSLLKAALVGSPESVIIALQDAQLNSSMLDFVWKRMIEFVRGMLWYKYGIKNAAWSVYESEFSFFAAQCSAQLFHHFLYTMHKEYSLFTKTSAQHAFLEMVCIGIAQKTNRGGAGSSEGSLPAMVVPPFALSQAPSDDDEVDDESDDEQPIDNDEDAVALLWKRVVSDVTTQIDNPLLTTVLQQARVQKSENELIIQFPKDFYFFSDVVQAYNSALKNAIHASFGELTFFKTIFTHEQKIDSAAKTVRKEDEILQDVVVKKSEHRESYNSDYKKKIEKEVTINYREPSIDISDKESWKKAHMILEFFPGRITEICEKTNEQQV